MALYSLPSHQLIEPWRDRMGVKETVRRNGFSDHRLRIRIDAISVAFPCSRPPHATSFGLWTPDRFASGATLSPILDQLRHFLDANVARSGRTRTRGNRLSSAQELVQSLRISRPPSNARRARGPLPVISRTEVAGDAQRWVPRTGLLPVQGPTPAVMHPPTPSASV